MQSKILMLLLLSIIYMPLAHAEEISVVSADTTWGLTLNDATDVGRLIGEPGVMVVKYADTIGYNPLDNASGVGRLTGEPSVMVVKYADIIGYNPLDNASDLGRLVGEPGVMVVKYADTIGYYPLENSLDNQPPTKPQVTSISPNQTAAGTFDLTINGDNFDNSSVDQIYWKADNHFVGNGTIKTRSKTQIVVTESMGGAQAGIYVIKVKNSDGQISNGAELTIITSPSKPVAAFSATPTTGFAPLKVTFTDMSIGTPTSWKWSFGDGKTSTVKNPVYTYGKAGNYTVNLTVVNAAGSNTSTRPGYIVVNVSKPPVAVFSASPTTGKAPLTVTFTDKSINNPTSWSWNFGDKSTSTSKNAVHRYSKAGKYTISLTVKNAVGSNTVKKTNYIIVK